MRLFVLRLLACLLGKVFAQSTEIVKASGVLGNLCLGTADIEDRSIVRNGGFNGCIDRSADITEAFVELVYFSCMRVPFLNLVGTGDDDMSGVILDCCIGDIIDLTVFIVLVDVIEHAA